MWALYDLRARYDAASRETEAAVVSMTTLLNAASAASIAHAAIELYGAGDPADHANAIARASRQMAANLDLVAGLSEGPASEQAAAMRATLAENTDDLAHGLSARDFSALVSAAAIEGETSLLAAHEERTALLDGALVTIGLGALVAAALSALLGMSITTPLKRLMRFTEAFMRGEPTPALPNTASRSEIGRLSNSFDRMASALDKERKRLRRLAYFDEATALPNRAGFTEEVDRLLASPGGRSRGQLVALRFPRLPMMEGLFGNGYGRLAEIAVKDRLIEILADPEATGGARDLALGRLRFDVFGVFATETDEGLADRLRAAFARAAQVSERMIRFEPSGAIARAVESGSDAQTLIDAAEVALDRAAQTGPSLVFSAEMRDQALHDRETDLRLRAALDNGDIHAAFQPKICCRSERVVGFEALARCRQADGAPMPPSVFVPMAERLGFISMIDYAILRQAVSAAARLRADGRDVCAAVNLSAATLEDPAMMTTIEGALNDAGLPADRLEIEITESVAVADMQRTTRKLNALRSAGVGVAIDDFGTGYSGLAALRAMPIDTLKFDRGLLPRDQDDADAIAVYEAVLVMGRKLRLHTVAEGVETEWQRDFLRDRGCDVSQGFYYGRPMWFDELQQLILRQETVSDGAA